MSLHRIILIVMLGLLAAPVVAAEAPEQVLARFGLRQEGEAWAPREHSRLRRLLERFDATLRRFHKSEQAWREQVERIESLEKQHQGLETQYEENRRLLQQPGTSPVSRQQLQEQRGQLSQRLGELRLVLKRRQNEEDSALYEAARRHAAARAELLSITAALEQAYRRLDERYESLAASTTVQQALAELRTSTGISHTLGSPSSLRHQVEIATSRAAKVLHTETLPLLANGGAAHVDALAAGRPATFVVDEDHAPTLVSASQAERLGILHERALWQSQVYGGREIHVCSAVLSTLQVGTATLRDVEVYVTSGEDADLGLRLGSDVLDRIGLKVDRGRAQIEVRPSSSSRRDARH